MALDIRSALNGTTRRLSHIRRYSSIPVIRGENVAEHSWQVAWYSYLIAIDLWEDGVTLDLAALLAKAVSHDVSEAASGDIIRSYKYGSDEMLAATRAADLANMVNLARELGLPAGDNELMMAWRYAKDGTTEGEIITFADLLCVVGYCVEERHLGNQNMDRILSDAWEFLLTPYMDHDLFGRYVRQIFPTGHYTDAYRPLEG